MKRNTCPDFVVPASCRETMWAYSARWAGLAQWQWRTMLVISTKLSYAEHG